MATDLIDIFLNFAIPPTAIATLLLLLPQFYICKLFFNFFSSLFPENMNNKVVLITGASSGIGEQIAYEYARKGACLVLAARREQSLRDVAENAQALGSPDAIVVQADVSDIEDCRRMVGEAINHFGRLDHLVNNAGIAQISMFEEVEDISNLRPVMDINFWGSVGLTQYAIPYLKRSRGRIVVTSSFSGLLSFPRMSIYNASKAALTTFYETLRTELGEEIGITIAFPGLIESELTKGKFLSKEGGMQVDQEMRDAALGVIPVETAAKCAEAIVDGARRGDRRVMEPAWFRAVHLWKVLLPEAFEWCSRMMYVEGFGGSEQEVLSKKMIGVAGARALVYPNSIRTPGIKEG